MNLYYTKLKYETQLTIMSQTTLFSLLCFMMIISHFSLIHRGLRRRARYSYDQVSVGNDTMEYPPSRHIDTTLASK